jgi:hypothetical protein
VALDKARDKWGAKNFIWEGEKAGTVGGTDNNNCWSIPTSWLFVIPLKIFVIRNSGILAGWLGEIFIA